MESLRVCRLLACCGVRDEAHGGLMCVRAHGVVSYPSLMQVAPGTRLGPYEIVAPIGAGGMGEVYRGRDTRLDRTVAVKILPAEYANDAKFKIRFEREAKAISSLNHPHICTLYDVGDSYLVMEYCEGQTLADRIRRGALPFEDV